MIFGRYQFLWGSGDMFEARGGQSDGAFGSIFAFKVARLQIAPFGHTLTPVALATSCQEHVILGECLVSMYPARVRGRMQSVHGHGSIC